jgi:hypothetical protein
MKSEKFRKNLKKALLYSLIGAAIGFIFATTGSSTGGT